MGRWYDLQRMITERRLGFRMSETMKGTHTFCRDWSAGGVQAGATLPLEFTVTWGADHLEQFLNPLHEQFMQTALQGAVHAGGLGDGMALEGTLWLGYLERAAIRYEFQFTAHGRTWRYVGEKREIRPWNLHRTHTTCYGTVTEVESNLRLSDSIVYFDLKTLPAFLASWRWG
jgi:hypothetical protein